MDRKTRQRFLLMDLFKKSDVPLSPKEVHEKALQEHPNLGLATVYRFIEEFLAEGILVAAAGRNV